MRHRYGTNLLDQGVSMKAEIFYKTMSKFYDLIDVIYFRNDSNSPGKVVFETMEDGDSVLDLCTGTATNALKIAKANSRSKVLGIDLSADMLGLARKKAQKAGISNIKLYYMDATKLKFKDKCFDKILLSLVLHEIDDELADGMINEAKRVLKDDGEIIITEWERSKKFFNKILFLPIEVLEPKTYKAFICKDLKAYFKKYGLIIKSEKHCDYSKVLILKKMKDPRK